jgi:hypothetical protein
MQLVSAQPAPSQPFAEATMKEAKTFTSLIVLAGMATLLLTSCSEPVQPHSATSADSTQLSTSTRAELLAEGDSTATNLFNDSLIAPDKPTLVISATAGLLHLSWDSSIEPVTTRVYQFDTLTREEQLLGEYTGVNESVISIPSQTHLRAWQREQFRVEVCSANDCISSERIPLSNLTEQTLTYLYPGNYIEQERYAEHFALNLDASLLIASLPVAGAIDIFTPGNAGLINTQRVRLGTLEVSVQRQLQLSASASGDTLMVAIDDESGATLLDLRVLERLGEIWIETGKWEFDKHNLTGKPQDNSNQKIARTGLLQLDDDGDSVLFTLANQLYTGQRTETGWIRPYPIITNTDSDEQGSTIYNMQQSVSLISATGSGNLDTVFMVTSLDQQLSLIALQKNSLSSPASWNKIAEFPLFDMDPNREMVIRSNDDGSLLAIAGWENTQAADSTVIMRRFSLDDANSNLQTDAASIVAIDSLRYPPTEHAFAKLRFSANRNLDTVAIGWQANETDTVEADAALGTYRFDTISQRWIALLELPEAIPTLAKQAFAGNIQLSADGQTLMISTQPGQSLSAINRAGEIRVLH